MKKETSAWFREQVQQIGRTYDRPARERGRETPIDLVALIRTDPDAAASMLEDSGVDVFECQRLFDMVRK